MILIRTQVGWLDDLIDDTARDIFSALCEGDGQHSEELDRAIIVGKLSVFAATLNAARTKSACAGCGGRGTVGGYEPEPETGGSRVVDVPCPDCKGLARVPPPEAE